MLLRSRARISSAFVFALLSTPLALVTHAAADDPASIMQQLQKTTLNDRRSGRMRLTVNSGGSSRERTLRIRAKGDGQVRKSLLLVEDPPDIRGTGFLSVDYIATHQEAERWLHLPKLKRTTRVAGTQLSSSFLGSDLTFADLAPADPSKFQFRMVKSSDTVDGEDCWQIAAVPKEAKVRDELGYKEFEVWISKSKLTLVRMRATLLDEKRQKYFQASQFRKVGETWFPDRLVVRTVENGKAISESVLQSTENNYDATIIDEDFTKQRLESGL
jgi:hypothetical protein